MRVPPWPLPPEREGAEGGETPYVTSPLPLWPGGGPYRDEVHEGADPPANPCSLEGE